MNIIQKLFLSLFFITALTLLSCREKGTKSECVLDNISHIEERIYYHIDSLPRLCDELEMQGRLVDIGGCRLYYEIEGEGVPMVVINGGPGGTHHYFHPWFAAANDYCKVIYYDQRGCGQSDFVPEKGYSFRQAIDDLDKLRQALGIDKWVVCGYSYGGALAQFYATQYAEHVSGMVLIGAAPLLQDPILDEDRQYDYISQEEQQRIEQLYNMYSKGELGFVELLYNKELNGDWKRQNFYKPTNEESIRAALYEWVNDRGFNYAVGSDYMRYDFKGVFDANPIPTLICEGKWDLSWASEKADLIRQNHPNAQFVFFERAGHSIFSEDPDRFFSSLKKFVKSLAPVSETELAVWKQQAADIIAPQVALFDREENFFALIEKDGVDSAREFYTTQKQSEEKLFTETAMNNLGYEYLGNEDFDSAIKLFEMNVDTYPESANAYDSLGEAWLESGNSGKAREYYAKALVINPNLQSAKEALEKLNANN